MNPIRPEFIRLPAPNEFCPYTGMSRSVLYRLTVPCKANGCIPQVPAKPLRGRGKLRGIWLIPFDQLVAYIHAQTAPAGKEVA
jgi:hypothetical protein